MNRFFNDSQTTESERIIYELMEQGTKFYATVLIARNFDQIVARAEAAEARAADLLEENRELSEEVETLRAEVEVLKQLHLMRGEALDVMLAERDELRKKLNAAMRIAREKTAERDDYGRKYSALMQESGARILEVKVERDAARALLDRAVDQRDAAWQELHNIRVLIDADGCESTLDEVANKVNQLKRANERIGQLEALRDEMAHKIDKLIKERDAARQELEALKRDLSEAFNSGDGVYRP